MPIVTFSLDSLDDSQLYGSLVIDGHSSFVSQKRFIIYKDSLALSFLFAPSQRSYLLNVHSIAVFSYANDLFLPDLRRIARCLSCLSRFSFLSPLSSLKGAPIPCRSPQPSLFITMKTMKSRRGGNDRGGIRKRGPTRTDRDGDMDMDAGGSRAKRNRTEKSGLGGRAAGAGVGGRASGTGNRASGAGNRVPARDKHLDAIQRAIASVDSQANIRQGNRKPAGNLEQFSVRGWKSSKAASNRDGGLESLIAFLERRMNSFIKSGPRAKITKVSPSFATAVTTNIELRHPPLCVSFSRTDLQ